MSIELLSLVFTVAIAIGTAILIVLTWPKQAKPRIVFEKGRIDDKYAAFDLVIDNSKSAVNCSLEEIKFTWSDGSNAFAWTDLFTILPKVMQAYSTERIEVKGELPKKLSGRALKGEIELRFNIPKIIKKSISFDI